MIKERIIQLIESKGIAKEEFYVKIGMTSASFRGSAKNTPLNSTAIENIISIIPDVNTDWLLTGKGEMLQRNEKGVDFSPALSDSVVIPREMFDLLKNQVETILSQQRTIENLAGKKDTAVAV